MSKIGFIGLGIMGAPMAMNLVKAGCDVTVYNRTAAKMEACVAAGAKGAESAAQVAAECDIIVTMLPNSTDVKALLLGENGIGQYAKPGTLFVDMTSGAPGDSREIYAELKKNDVHIVDAPVSGGEPMAIAGTLAIMVGGDVEDFERAKEVFDVVGSSATWWVPSAAATPAS